MKVHHFALLFLVFFLAAVIRTDIAIGKLKSIENEREELTASLDSATVDAVSSLAKFGTYGTNSINKDVVVDTFLTSLYSSLGIISDREKQKEFEMYIPVILLCDSDGYYAYYNEEYKGADGYTYTGRKWSEKMPYYYKDNDFIYRFNLTDTVGLYDINGLLPTAEKLLTINYHELQKEDIYKDFRGKHKDCILLNDEVFALARKGAIVSQLEKVLSYYTSKYNEIARKNGITYNFSFPSGDEKEWADYMDDVNLLVVFQGYPYGAGRNYTFNKIAAAGANLIRKPIYYIEKKSWFYLAHKAGCPKLAASTTVLDESFDNLEECAKYGAYCCECIDHAARVPDIK